MTNSIAEYWDVDGISLHTFAHSIESTGEHVRGTPYLRGSDVQIPFRPGESWKPKVPGPRTITLKMWVRGTDENGVSPSDPLVKHALFNDNFNSLKTLLWRTDRQVVLTKRWYTLVSGVPTLMSATALGEYVAGLDNMNVIDQNRDAQAGKFTVDLRLSDPYFYGPWVSLGATGVVKNIGEDTARQLKITFSAAGFITNSTTGRTLNVGGACLVDTWNFAAPGHLETVVPHGQPDELFWFTLVRGNNAVSSGGVSNLQYRPVYL